MERRLAAILIADFVGSTAFLQADEEGALTRISSVLGIARECIEQAGGRVFNTAGDSVLAEFRSPVSALRAAIETRARLGGGGEHTAEDMRFGLHVADVVADGDDLKGEGVNVAARLQATADPGAIDVSETLFTHVVKVSPCKFETLEPRHLKGIAEPVQVYRVSQSADRHVYQIAPTRDEPAVAPRPNSVAVLPFRVTTGADEDQAFLADGLTDDLIHELSLIRPLFVSSRTASHAVDTNDPIAVGQRLGVRYVLSGTIRKLGDRVRLSIELSGTRNGELIWSERIQRPFNELLDAMEEIAARVAATVSGRIDHAEIGAARQKRPENMSAYEFYLRGLEEHRLSGIYNSHARQAIGWFRKAQEADPGFARPLAMEVCAWSYLPDFDLGQSEKLLMRALELDPSDPELHRILGIVLIKRHRDYASSRRHHEKALELAPNDAYIVGRCAAFFTFAGEPERAFGLLDRAEGLDPYLPVWVVEERIAALYALGRFEEVNRAALDLPFQTRRTRCYRAAARVARGDIERARILIGEALTDDPSLSIEYVRSQELYEDQDRMECLVDRLRQAGLPDNPQNIAGPIALQ